MSTEKKSLAQSSRLFQQLTLVVLKTLAELKLFHYMTALYGTDEAGGVHRVNIRSADALAASVCYRSAGIVLIYVPGILQLKHYKGSTYFNQSRTPAGLSLCFLALHPINMPLRARTGPVLVRCCQHRTSTGPVLATSGMFTGCV